MASLVLPVAPVPCTRHLHCARAIASLAFRRQLVSVNLLASRLRKLRKFRQPPPDRADIMAIIGMFLQGGFTGSACGTCALYTASPLRAFDNELGVQAPVGFCDPASFAAVGNYENFASRFQTGRKHGGVSMLGTMGHINSDIIGKLTGFLSPSAGLKFGDIPNGLAAISKGPAGGRGQILAYGGFCELSQDQSAGTKAGAGDFSFKVLASGIPAEKTMNLSADLANGRLAIMPFIGTALQDVLTGSAYCACALITASPLRAFVNELGIQALMGFCDPAGFTAD